MSFNNLRTQIVLPWNEITGVWLRTPGLLRQPIPTKWLIAEYLINGSWQDTSPWWTADWTPLNVWFPASEFGYNKEVWSFNGSSSEISIISTIIRNLINSRNPFSIAYEINLNNVTNGQIILDWRWSDFNWMFLQTNAWNLEFVRSDGTVADVWCTVPISASINCSAVFTYDWTNCNWYLNWVFQNTWTSTRTLNSNGTIFIWRAWPFSWGFLNWKLWLLRIYNRILTTQEIITLDLEASKLLH